MHDKGPTLITKEFRLKDLSSKNNFEHGIRNGGGGVILELSDFQYDKLVGKDYGRRG
ncbi:hypothetical protein [Granulicella sp. S190]|uniref:hypothetical protein n=1 Tax=Granulicella sp. S190 TaxID=1747226 RepID=UPI00131BB588|nr:hypothetical protein [Granulicella sp. S190]